MQTHIVVCIIDENPCCKWFHSSISPVHMVHIIFVCRDDDDYDIDFYTVGPVPPDVVESQAPTPSVREQLEVSL